MLYNTLVLKELVNSLQRRKRAPLSVGCVPSASAHPGCSSPLLSARVLLVPQLAQDGIEKHSPGPDAAFGESHLQGTDLVSFTPSSPWSFRRKWVVLRLESQQTGVGRSWSVPESSGSDDRQMLSQGGESRDLRGGFSACRAARSDETSLDRGCRICKLFR